MSAGDLKRGRLSELDALRGLGAILVLNFHYSTRFHEIFPKAPHVPFHIGGGEYRVLLFFAISGFAIFFSTARLQSGWDFVANRAARLLPPYWTAMLLTLVIEHLGHMTTLYIPPFATLMNVTMLQGFFFLPPVDGAYWTLTVEIAFYACILGLWALFRMRHIERFLIAWLLLKLFFDLIWPDMPERIVMLFILRYVPWFAIGMASWRVWAGERRWRDQIPVFLGILITIMVSETTDIWGVSLLIIAAFWAMVEGRLGWIRFGPLIWVGQISYSLYLVHQHIGFTIMMNAQAMGIDPLTSYVVAVLAALALGYCVNRLVERPASAWILARWKRFRARQPMNAAREGA
ncbi:MAG TPA: acyltransferase [Sphingobium sp.]|uniref:acyltransferase family protein n=1 Tax=Sphingobium sp. TaxID=1912891 RepID=UPI002ED564EF